MTYSDLVTTVLQRAFPEGIAANLRAIYSKRVLDGLIELQRWVPYLKTRQQRLYPFGSTLYRQGTTSICKPAGKVKRVWTFNSKTLKDVVYYDYCTREDIDRLTASRARAQKYPEAVPYEFGAFNATPELDKGHRSERGLFCIDKDEIILLPHIESTERIGVDFAGSTTSYSDTDAVDFGKYEEQVIAALENWLRWKSVGKDDRSTSDYGMMLAEWRESVSGLQLDTKDDTEPVLPVEDIGILPRQIMPDAVVPWSLGCTYDPAASFFSKLWMLCLGNNKFYNLGALLLDGQVVEMVSGSGSPGGRPEVTYETIRSTNVNLKADDNQFYHLALRIVDGEPTHGFDDGAVSTTGATICDNTSVVNLDIIGPDNSTYYRFNLVLQDGVPTISMSDAPDEPETPVVPPTSCSSVNAIVLKDVITQKCVRVQIKNGVFTVDDA